MANLNRTLGLLGAGLQGFKDPQAVNRFLQREQQQKDLAQIGNILSGQSIPEFLQRYGPETEISPGVFKARGTPLTAEETRQRKIASLAALDSPLAQTLVQQAQPLAPPGANRTAPPAAVRTFQFRQQLSPEDQRQFDRMRRLSTEEALKRRGLILTPDGSVVPLRGFGAAQADIARKQEEALQQTKTAFEPAREAAKVEEKKRAQLRVDLERAFPALEASFNNTLEKKEIVDNLIDEVLPKVNLATAGFASLLDVIPGTPQADLAAQIQTIISNLGIDELQAMREASPTGGALGAISDKESEILQTTIANLRNSQSPTQLKRNLQHLKKVLNARQTRLQKAFDRDLKRIGPEAAKRLSAQRYTPIPPRNVQDLSDEELQRIIQGQ